ncbi:MAG: chromate resistance protein [Acidobacteriota bacterium]|nr:chromate resistance protein [Acidobacteriota bacterium]
MKITSRHEGSPWLLLVFTLPSSKASQRVGIWRKLQKIGSIPLHKAGYVLPNTAENLERFEWLAAEIKGFDGEASVLVIESIDDVPPRTLEEQFRQVRAGDYAGLIEELGKLKPTAKGVSAQLPRLRRRYEEIAAIDFFESPLRRQTDEALKLAEEPRDRSAKHRTAKAVKSEFQGRTWLTRPRPGIDRVSSAWLICGFIDPRASFAFGSDAATRPDAVPFDMFQAGGFGHEGDQCTFETLCLAFAVTDSKVQLLAQAIHDADLEDNKFGRSEGHTMNQILKGWATQDIADDELLRRGMDLIAGLYHSMQ